jgi:hypothetical protein
MFKKFNKKKAGFFNNAHKLFQESGNYFKSDPKPFALNIYKNRGPFLNHLIMQ